MASTCRSSLRLLPNTVVRRRSGRARSLALPSRSQCENCICNTAAPLWRERARHGHAYRHFSVSAVESGDTNISAGQASRVEPPPTARNANHKSLHSSAHSLLKVRFGHMKESEVAEARAFISIISKWHNEEGATLCEALLERLFTEQKSSNSGIIVDTEMYNICMDSWCKSNADGGKIANRVQSIMQRMEERYFGRNNDHPKKSAKQNAARPDNWSYNCLINAYSKWEVDSSAKVEEVLEKMTALAKGAASSSNALDQEYAMRIQPDTFTYNSLMNYYASRENDHRAARRAEDLLLHMSELAKGEGDIRMDTTSFNIVLKAWSNSGGGIYGAERAESMLRRMIKLYGGGHENVRPNAVSFSTVINSYARVDPEDTPLAREKVMGILDVIEGSYFPDSCDISACYAAAANVIVKSGADDAVERVQELMYRMKNMDAIPDRKINASLVEALGNKGSDESFRLAIDHLSEMSKQRVSDLDKDAVIPFNMLLRSVLREDSSAKMQKAEEIFALMDNLGGFSRPDVSSYNMMISELSRSTAKDAEQKAVGHLRNMLKSYRDGYEPAKPDSFAFNCIISMLARSKQGEWADDVIYKTLMAMENHQKQNPSVRPDTITFNLAIGRLAKTFSKKNAKKVMKLLVMMEETATCNPALAPDILTYTSVLSIQTRVDPRRAADVASTYLKREMSKGRGMQVDRPGMQSILHALSRSRQFDHAMLSWRAWKWIEDSDKGRVILDSALCNLVFIGFSHSDGPEGAENSLLFLSERMKRHKENGETAVLPTNVGFSACLSTLAKADRIDDAIRVLEIMKVLTRDGVPNTRLDDGCYNSILTNLAREASKNVAPHAIKVVHHMKENLGEVPTAPLNSAINACSRISQNARPIVRSEALDIASKLFRWGGESSSRDSVTFGLMIRTCSKLAGDDIKRYKLVEHLFKLSAKSGLVGNMVMREISKSPELKKILIGDRELPKEWSVNATDY